MGMRCGGFHPRQADPRITLQKLPRWKCGSLSARTSALTLPNVVFGLCGRECGLLYFREIVVGIAVELHHADLDQRIVGLRPYLGQVERIMLVGPGLRLGHHLDRQRRSRKIAALDRLEQIAPMALAIVGDDRRGFFVGEILDALLRAEVEFDPDALIGGVDHREGVAAEAMHVAEASRDATIGHDDGDLVQRLGQQRPEVPIVVGAPEAGARIALDRVVEVGEAQRIAEEEDRRVVADDVPSSV